MSAWVGHHPGRIAHPRRALAHKVHHVRLHREGRDGVAHQVCGVNEYVRAHGGQGDPEWSRGRDSHTVGRCYTELSVLSGFGHYNGTLRTVGRVHETA